MKSFIKKLWFLFFVLSLSLIICSTSFGQKSYKELKYPPLHELKIPEVQREVLPNGMILFLVEDHNLPLIELSCLVRVGSVYEPADKVGLAEITGAVMRTGGTAKMNGDQIDEELDRLGATIETSIDLNQGTAYMSVLKEDIDRGLPILADILMNPQFAQDKIDLEKMNQRSWIARRNDLPIWIADREFSKLIYGDSSVYARTVEYKTIDNITRDDLIAFHQKYFHPNSVIMGVWGDFKTPEMIQKIKIAFAQWKTAKLDLPELPKVDYHFRPSVHLVKKEDINQTNIRVGHSGGMMNDPDYFALTVMNSILGRSFSGRLFKEVRSEQGLAYHVGGGYQCNFDYPGLLSLNCETKSQSTIQAIKSMMEEVKRISQQEVSDEELEMAKNTFLNSFVFQFDNKGKIVNRLLTYEYYGFPLDFLQKTKENIQKVTKQDILRAAQTHLHPNDLVILAVGKDSDFDQPLSVLGVVDTIDISGTEKKAPIESFEATPASLAKGKEILDQVTSASGGKDAFKSIANSVVKTETSVSTPQGEFQLSSTGFHIFPDKIRQEISMPFGTIVTVFDGEKGWMMSPQGTQDLPESQLKEVRSEFFRSHFHLFLADDLKAQFMGEESLEDKKVDVILISDPAGNQLKMYVDQMTHLPLKESYQGTTMMGPATVEEIFSDYREVSGVKTPFSITSLANGQKIAETKILEVNFNTQIDPELFIKK
ncbi:MAG: insulinase family protein [candidate division Zixibacteria bacterium]|nr:insulinase family protein [candidate division Zixibacteria bacterium]